MNRLLFSFPFPHPTFQTLFVLFSLATKATKRAYRDPNHSIFISIWYTIGMKFEYDSNKSSLNAQKHGIDFDDAKELWQDENLLEVPLNFPDETRCLCIAKIEGKYWSAVITYRHDTIRIISIRRSRKEEIEHYENS